VTRPPRSAMVLAAGLGMRLRPVTETIPKPLVEVGGRTLLDHTIDRLVAVGVERVVVNVHYKADLVAAHLARRRQPQILVSHEAELLDTGGGVAQAMPLLDDAFFVVNSDVVWLDGANSALLCLARAFAPEQMDAVLLLQQTATAVGYHGDGDYFLGVSGPHRRGAGEIAPYLFAGVQLLHKRLFDETRDRIFSLVRLFDQAERTGRLQAIVHDGEWYHIGTLDGLEATRARLARLNASKDSQSL
jgi:N-acetyl-alpha-D-muramate 1-phosphate uridylyltransferase